MQIDAILSALRARRCRITRARRAIIEVIASLRQPIAAITLHRRMAEKRVVVDRVTVYRELRFLHDAGIVHAVTFKDGIRRFELAPERGHKHHLICTSCQSVEDVALACADLHAVERSIEQRRNFQIAGHSLEFYGLCAKCV